MLFENRQDAGRKLAKELMEYAGVDDVVVLAIPRGGVSVAFEIASALHAPLDIFLSRKLGVPGYEEFAFGAVAAGDGRFLDQEIIEAVGISSEQIERITAATRKNLDDRARLYRYGRAPLPLQGRTVILVDDGVATGASIYAAVYALRQMKLKKLIIAVPVSPPSTAHRLGSLVDRLVVLYTPAHFRAVGQFYESFSQVSDDEVIDLLRTAERSFALRRLFQPRGQNHPPPTPTWDGVFRRELIILAGNVTLEGTLSIPKIPIGIVLFAHGSGSSRFSPRNRYVAEVFQAHGLATLLFDLLTREEDFIDCRTAELRFNIPFLAKRLIDVTRWVTERAEISSLPIGYFGASTGAAAAIMAAARLPGLVRAVVSRGGRPDLAGEALEVVNIPTLLIVGGLDKSVLSLNREALDKLESPSKQLVVVPGATHLFEEPGALEQVANLAAEWLVHYLEPGVEKQKFAYSSGGRS